MPLLSLHDRSALAARFRRDPALHLFELGDLDDLLWPHTSWYTLTEDGPAALLYGVGDIPTLLAFARTDRAAELEDLLHALLPMLPRRFFGHLSCGAEKILDPFYSADHHAVLLRMALTDPGRTDAHPDGEWAPAPLQYSDLPELTALFAESYPGNWFDERMLATGQYVGARHDGRLIAVAGVHVHSPPSGSRRSATSPRTPPCEAEVPPPPASPRSAASWRAPSTSSGSTCGPTTPRRSSSTGASASPSSRSSASPR